MQRLLEEQLEAERLAEKEKRIMHMQQRAMRRLFNQGIITAWSTWQDKWEEKKYGWACANSMSKTWLSASFGTTFGGQRGHQRL